MRSIRLYNAKIAQFSKDNPTFFEGELWTEDERISYVGPSVNHKDTPFSREIDCCGNLLLPGFKNAHSHTGMTFLRSHADELPLQHWLFDQVIPYENLLTENDIYTLVKLGVLEYLSSGITSAMDMYYFAEAAAQACVDSGFRMVIGCGGSPLSRAVRQYDYFKNYHSLISYRLGVHSEYTEKPDDLEALASFAKSQKEPFCLHIHETEKEIQDCMVRTGMRPLELLDKIGAFDFGGTGYHLIHLNEQDFEILKNRHIYAVTCPSSNLKLSSGICPVSSLLRKGIPVAIGTDGPASNNCLDMFREMYLVSGLQRLTCGTDACTAEDVLVMACSTGARAMYLDACDDLMAGNLADIIMIDLSRPSMQPENALLRNVVFSGGKDTIRMTMINGSILYENGSFHINDDPERIYREASDIIRRMEKSLAE
ncbi:MAG: amidohydrolase family protein [Clostridia bacterium]|nr:amidohydrolase family protein [Clostridia bacterium]